MRNKGQRSTSPVLERVRYFLYMFKNNTTFTRWNLILQRDGVQFDDDALP